VDLLLALMHRLLMSTHHGRRPAGAAEMDVARADLQPRTLLAGPLTVDLETPRPNLDDCWVATRWAADGALLSVTRGAGSVSIVA
jgi:hypothetical protein